MSDTNFDVDICVIGAGSGGLSAAAGASQLGASTLLIESHKMGGDCLNTGCVRLRSMERGSVRGSRRRSADIFGCRAASPMIIRG